MNAESNNKPTLILGSGLLCDAEIWAFTAEHLSDIAQVQLADTLQDDNLPAMAERLLDTAPSHFAYAGFSMGGYLGFELLRRAPQRITRLALLSTTAQPDSVEHIQLREMLIELTRQNCFEQAVERNLSLFLTPPFNGDKQRQDVMLAMAKRVGPQAYIRQQKLIVNRPDSRPILQDINIPTCIICGRDDQLTPIAKHQEMAERISNAQLHVLNNARHFITFEQPRAVTDLLRNWLSDF